MPSPACSQASFLLSHISSSSSSYHPELNNAEHWWIGISPEGIGVIGALLNFVIALTIGRLGTPPPQEVRELVDDLRIPTGAGIAHRH